MKYLKRVILNNFQSHKYSVVEFDEGLNIIVGPSDSGKSAIIRGIKWVLYNEPSGNYFIREGENEASVILEFSNDIKIKRLRSRSKNAYILYNREGEEIVFEGFGNKVPQEIVDLLSIEKIPLDSNETNSINIGEQLEGAFLLSEKGSTRASAIGRLIGVNLIDDALKELLKDIRNISISKKKIEKDIERTENELTTYEYLDNLQNDVVKLEGLKNIMHEKNNLKNELIKILKQYNNIIKEIQYLDVVLSTLSNVDNLEKNIYNLENKSRQLNSYKYIKTKLSDTNKQIIYDKNLIGKLINNDIVTNKLNKIISMKDKLQILKKLKTEKTNYENENFKISTIIKRLEGLDSINSKINTVETIINRLEELSIIKINLDAINKSINMGEAYMVRLDSIDTIDILFKDLDVSIARRHSILNYSKKFNQIKSEIENQNEILNIAKKNMNNNLKIYEDLLMKSEICPFCLSDINENKIEHIIKHYS